jgi:hypothetical protein
LVANFIICQQIVSKDVPGKHQDLVVGLALERGNLRVQAGAANDVGVIPWFGLFCGYSVWCDDLSIFMLVTLFNHFVIPS